MWNENSDEAVRPWAVAKDLQSAQIWNEFDQRLLIINPSSRLRIDETEQM